MNQLRKAAILPFMLLLAPCALAQSKPAVATDAAAAYSHTLQLSFSGKEALVQLRLPKDVYLQARSSALSDLRLFDRAGNKVPFALTTPAPQAQVSVRALPVAIFPVNAAVRGGVAALDIRTSADGSLVSVNTRTAPAGPGTESLAALVLDTRQTVPQQGAATAPAFGAFRLSLPPGVSNYTARVELEVSDDLKRWDSLGDSVVSWMTNSDTKALANDRIEFDPRQFRYARLSWRQGSPIVFSNVAAEVRSHIETPAVLDTMLLTAQPGKAAGDLSYQSASAIPVQSLGLKFAEQNVVLPALLGQYTELPAIKENQSKRWEFEPSFKATFYQLTQAGRSRASGDIALAGAHVPQWVLRPLAALASPPTLRISWQPASMIFLANGTGPYTLAVGRGNAVNAAADVALVAPGFDARELSSLEHAVAGPLQQQRVVADLAGEADAAGKSARTRAWMLWGVLGLGLMVLAAMVRGLFKQMPSESAGENGGA